MLQPGFEPGSGQQPLLLLLVCVFECLCVLVSVCLFMYVLVFCMFTKVGNSKTRAYSNTMRVRVDIIPTVPYHQEAIRKWL